MVKSIRVLIADDNARSRNGLRALLTTVQLSSSAPVRTDTDDETGPDLELIGEAVNGREAVRLVEQYRPDVVLMDARMPEMDGLEATRLIKKKWPKVRVVVLTIYVAYQAKALAAGADAFLVKGCPNEELFTAILNNEKPQPIYGC